MNIFKAVNHRSERELQKVLWLFNMMKILLQMCTTKVKVIIIHILFVAWRETVLGWEIKASAEMKMSFFIASNNCLDCNLNIKPAANHSLFLFINYLIQI